MPDNLSSNAKCFADDTSTFSVVHEVDTSTKELHDDLKKINEWALQQKMIFNPDLNKQAQEVILISKIKKTGASVFGFQQ